MSQDSLVSQLPAQGWSCETLADGVRHAAAMSGMALQPGQMAEARGTPICSWMVDSIHALIIVDHS